MNRLRKEGCAALLAATLAGCGGGNGSRTPTAPDESDPSPGAATAFEAPGAEPAKPAAGKGAAPDASTPPAGAGAPPTDPKPASAVAAPNRRAGADADPAAVRARIKKIEDLESRARFDEAWSLCNEAMRTYRGHPESKPLRAMRVRLREAQHAARELQFSVQQLASPEPYHVNIAKSKLVQGGAVGRLILRRAVEIEPPEIARVAAGVLGELNDYEASPMMLKRLEATTDDPFAAALAKALQSLAAKPPKETLPALMARVKADASFGQRHQVTYLASVYAEACDRDKKAFDELLGDADAFAVIRKYVLRGQEAKDAKISQWAAGLAAVFEARVRGLRAAYYAGTNFETLAAEFVEARISARIDRFPFPDGRRERVSIRWTGYISIPQAGTYTFFSASDDGQRVWVNGERIIDDWTDHGVQEQKKTAHWKAGTYPFKVEYYQGGGEGSITVSWQGPGFNKRVITVPHFTTDTWPGMKRRDR